MSAPAAPSMPGEGEKPRVYSQTPSAIALRVRRAKQKAEVVGVAEVTEVDEVAEASEAAELSELAALPSTDYHDHPTAPSEVARQVRRKPGEYSQTRNAIASRKRQAEMDPEERTKMLERQAKYAALTRARRATKNQEGFENLSDAEQQKLLADEEARVIRERATEDTAQGPYVERYAPRPTKRRMQSEHTTLSADKTPTTSESQSSLELSDVTQPTLGSEVGQRTAQPHITDQPDHQHVAISYPHHPVLDLEPLIGDLSERDARIASLLFGLVREDHDRSGDHVEGLCRLFAPTRERLDTNRVVAEQKRVALAEAEIDVLKYETFVGDLEDGEAENARALLVLVRGNLKGKLGFAALLNDLFLPLKLRNIDDHVVSSTFQGVFEKLDNAVNHNGNDAAQPT